MELVGMNLSVERILGLLHAVLVEIRETNDLQQANQLADIFHELPVHLMKASEMSDLDQALEHVIVKAHSHRLDHYIWDFIDANYSEKL